MFKKQLIAAAVLGAAFGSAHADPMYYDVGTAGGAGISPDVNTLTDVFEQMQLFANTTTTVYDTNTSGAMDAGDRFLDNGSAVTTALLPVVGTDTEGLNSTYEMTVRWTGLKGRIAGPLNPDGTQSISYDVSTNTTFSFWYDGAMNSSFGGSVGSADDTGFNDGTHILDLRITGGNGVNKWDITDPTNPQYESGGSSLFGEVTYALPNFWYFDSDGDGIASAGDKEWSSLLGAVVPITIVSHIDQNTDNVVTDYSGAGAAGPAGYGDELVKVLSDHDGSIDFVPEPTSILLLGAGLLGLGAAVGRRRKAS